MCNGLPAFRHVIRPASSSSDSNERFFTPPHLYQDETPCGKTSHSGTAAAVPSHPRGEGVRDAMPCTYACPAVVAPGWHRIRIAFFRIKRNGRQGLAHISPSLICSRG